MPEQTKDQTGFSLHLRLTRPSDSSPSHQLAGQRAQRDTEAQQSTLKRLIFISILIVPSHNGVLY